jgi:hemolysin III
LVRTPGAGIHITIVGVTFKEFDRSPGQFRRPYGGCPAIAVFGLDAKIRTDGKRGTVLESPALARRELSRGEIAADGAVHAVGIVAAVAGIAVLISLIAVRSGAVELITAAIYGFGLLAMLGFSAAYNLAGRSRHRDLLRRVDRAAIFLMIAGTYTPFTILGLSGVWEVSLISVVWSFAIVGFIVTFLLPRRLGGLSVAVYLILGWTGIVAIGPLLDAFGAKILVLIAIGGLLYSLGTVFLVWRNLPYQHAIWHGFVVAAAAVHYGAILDVMIAG